MRTNPDLVLREIYGKAILMPVRYNEASNDPIYLNDVAAQIWKCISGSDTRDVLQKSICDMYGVCEDSAEACAIKSFVTDMIEKKLIFN